MNESNRLKNSLINTISALINQIILVLFSFIIRTIFIKKMGVNYLGLSGLFSNIITVFSLAELGLSSSIVYSLYKPIAEKDYNKINLLINFYRKLYLYIIIFILLFGIMLIPGLKFIINSSVSYTECLRYYGIYFIDAIFSYIFVYKSLLLSADQRNYISSNINTIIVIIKSILQIICLVLLKSFMIYLMIQALATLMNNILISVYVNKKYKFIKDDEVKVPISSKEKKKLIENIKAQSIYKISNVFLNGTDNILISILVSTECVGYYSNYNIIIATVNTIITLIFNSLASSIGNFIAKEDKTKVKILFENINFIGCFIAIISNVLLLFLLNDFITLWIGKEFLLSKNVLIVIVMNFFITCLLQTITVFRNTTGIFKETKYIMVIAAIINLILSVVLGLNYGLFGILLASFVSRLITCCWYEPKILFEKYSNIDLKKYLFLIFKTILNIMIIIFISSFATKFIPISYIGIISKFIIISIISVLTFVLFNLKNIDFKNVLKMVVDLKK